MKKRNRDEIAKEIYGKSYEECCGRKQARIKGMLVAEEHDAPVLEGEQ